jgi:hypothetical protein
MYYKRHLRFIVDLLSTPKTDLALRIGDPNERVPYGDIKKPLRGRQVL